MKKLLMILGTGIIFTACSTAQHIGNINDLNPESPISIMEEEIHVNKSEVENCEIQEEQEKKEENITVVYIEKPVYIPEEKASKNDYTRKSGIDAVTESQKAATQSPENYKSGTFFYQYNDDFVYEVYAQPYHLTDIALQPGEVVIGTPLLSEDESVWELTAGVGRDPVTGEDVQHLFVKPTYSKQDSTLIIITDRRVYHFRLKSFSNTHMAIVKFTYPLEKNRWATKIEDTIVSEDNYIRKSNPEFLSFDYKVKCWKLKKPDFIPEQVYDDGQRTYIQVGKTVLQKQLPVLFNEDNEIINYTVKGNVFIIPRLINKVTLKLGKDKVQIEKNITKSTSWRK